MNAIVWFDEPVISDPSKQPGFSFPRLKVDGLLTVRTRKRRLAVRQTRERAREQESVAPDWVAMRRELFLA